MVNIFYYNDSKKKSNKKKLMGEKLYPVKRTGSKDSLYLEKYFLNLYIFFMWKKNFKKCIRNYSFGIDQFLKKSGIENFNSKFSFEDFYGSKLTFSDRVLAIKLFFSLNFLIFPLENYHPIKKFLSFIFIKKKPKC